MTDTFITEDGDEISIRFGSPVGDGMKGIVVNGEIISWPTDGGQPHHDDIDEDGARDLQLTNFSSWMNQISAEGSAPPLEHVSQILNLFSEYKSSTEIHIRLGLRGQDVDFDFDGSVLEFKSHFKSNPPPIAEDYEDGIGDVEFLEDYENWTKTFSDLKTAQQLLGRGGRDDNWQERDEDFSKSFSVYNNPENEGGSVGWISPSGEWFPLMEKNHDAEAVKIIKEKYPKWRWKLASPDKKKSWYPTKALEYKGWIRQSGDGNYSVWSIKDEFTGRMRRNLIDALSEIPDGKVYVDSVTGDSAVGYVGDIMDKYT